ncbi:MAG: hypothetical protein B7O98_02535 [Zestosphaera tikiterensis]|uniref:Uncharacterized protein n=1 Tax=Zestosphaera tikiterensis TaxID=1973259 RepID=A0A2R7Y711_9CREN|nr:MAG: hypothetical protein B7O98_02535 [Zestosphaera tikiterensis]
MEPLYILVIALTAFLISFLLMSLTRRPSNKPNEEQKKILEVIKCVNCGFEEKTSFKADDYVGKNVGKCPKCGGDLIVAGIYLEKYQQAEMKV